MKTNNVINQSKPIPSWFVYLANTVSNVTGDATAFDILTQLKQGDSG